MKNIHVLPTDKPSKLSILNNGKLNFGAEFISSSNSKAQNIYITSDEEIKEGDWYASLIVDEKTKWETTKLDCVVKADLNKTNEYLVEPFSKYCKKIILTTDQDLIADGVQAIDDEFLEWFVKNPSCEYVEVNKKECNYDEYRCYYDYKIILPQEKPKQETINEVAERLVKEHPDYKLEGYTEYQNGRFNGIIEGIEWQQERSYSEEEAYKIWKAGQEYWKTSGESITFEELIEQFKKK